MKKSFASLALLLIATAAAAATKPAFTGPDFSGVYDCTGDDAHEGKYTGTVTLSLVRSQSVGKYAAYNFKLEVPEYGTYLGQAAARGTEMGVHFALTDQATKDYGTGIVSFKKAKGGKWSFQKYYYEPEFKGGNYGTEQCMQR